MTRFSSFALAQLLLSATGALAGLDVDINDVASVKKAAALVAEDLMSFYTGEIPGILPGPPPDGDYYQWTGGALWATMLDYRWRTGDTQYDDKISEGLLWQRGPNDDYLPPNWTATAGNDDQAIWGMAALLAAETGFTEPEKENTTWAALAQNVFDEQSGRSRRVINGTCEGGLRWQIFVVNNGYNYISTLANVAYANLGAHLSRWEGNNETQAKLVEDTFEFIKRTELIDGKFNVFDGVHVPDCDQINKLQFSFAPALALESAALMYNSTNGGSDWKKLVDGLAQRTLDIFFDDGVAAEAACEPAQCTTDMTFYKAFLHRSLAATAAAAPYTADLVLSALKSSAAAAADTCTLGKNERFCDFVWAAGKSSGNEGAGAQMSVLSALLSVLPAGTPASGDDGGSGSGNDSNGGEATPSSGGDSPDETKVPDSSSTHAGVSAFVLLGSLLASFTLN